MMQKDKGERDRSSPTPAPEVVRRGGRARVLVVDDEPMMVASIARLLRRDHDVTSLTSAREALRVLREAPAFDVIVCDLMLPGMTGMELFEALSEDAPEQADRMVFLTGGACAPLSQEFITDMGERVLSKPFERDQLLALIAERLDQVGPLVSGSA